MGRKPHNKTYEQILEESRKRASEYYENNKAEILFFDGFNLEHLKTIGSVFNQLATKKTLFSNKADCTS